MVQCTGDLDDSVVATPVLMVAIGCRCHAATIARPPFVDHWLTCWRGPLTLVAARPVPGITPTLLSKRAFRPPERAGMSKRACAEMS